MSTLDYIAQPDLTTSSRRLLATRVLSVLPDNSYQQNQGFPSRRKNDILKGGLEYLRSLEKGYDYAHMGTHSLAFPTTKKDYEDVSDLLGDETKLRTFPKKIQNYCNTLEMLLLCQECSQDKIVELKHFFERIAQFKIKEEPVYAEN